MLSSHNGNISTDRIAGSILHAIFYFPIHRVLGRKDCLFKGSFFFLFILLLLAKMRVEACRLQWMQSGSTIKGILHV